MASIDDLTTWDFYRDPDPGPGALQDAMTGSAAPNLAELNFLNDEDVPDAYDIGFSSVNANTVGGATSGYYFSAGADFTIRMHFDLSLVGADGVVGIGMGIGEDRAGVNSAGIGFAVATSGAITLPGFAGAATNNDVATTDPLFALPAPYTGSLSVSYDASTGDVTVGAAPSLGAIDPLPPTATVTYDGATDLSAWNGDDLLVSFFLRSDTITGVGPWSGTSAMADFFDFTVVEGTPIIVPEPASLAMLGLGLGLIARRRR